MEEHGFQGKNAFADQAGLVPDASVIFDVGAHTGQTTARYRALYPKATIYAFEPYPPSFEKYVAAFADDRRVKPQRYAVADAAGPCRLHSYTNSATNSIYKARNRIERCFNKLKHFRYIATRYDRRAIYFLAFIHIACFMLWMR